MMGARFVVELRAEGHADEQEVSRRLRAALKVLLRSFGLRAVSIRPADAGATATGGQRTAVLQNTAEPARAG